MNVITKTQTPQYELRNLVNNPPFITNFPLLELRETQKREFKQNEHDLFHKAYNENTRSNYLIGACLLAVVATIGYGIFRLCKKSDFIMSKIKAAFK